MINNSNMILETISNYRKINNSVDLIIKKSGYKIAYLYHEMGMDNASFYTKRKHGKFTADELERLFKIIDIEKIEDKVLYEMSLEGEASGIISEEAKREWLDES